MTSTPDEKIYTHRDICKIALAHARQLADARLDATVRERARHEAPVARWVLVSERLPEMHVTVIVTTDYGTVDTACRAHPQATDRNPSDNNWILGNGHRLLGEVLAWQPMPAPWVAP